tara:strand:- start:288 stop:611 length:324 start_codon:yes stop_codon:yes gene_type:complete
MYSSKQFNTKVVQALIETFRHPRVRANLGAGEEPFLIEFEAQDYAYSIKFDEKFCVAEIRDLEGQVSRLEWGIDLKTVQPSKEETIIFELMSFLSFCSSPKKEDYQQ